MYVSIDVNNYFAWNVFENYWKIKILIYFLNISIFHRYMYVCVYFHTRVVFRNASVTPCSINPKRYSPLRMQLMDARRCQQFFTLIKLFVKKKEKIHCRAMPMKIRERANPDRFSIQDSLVPSYIRYVWYESKKSSRSVSKQLRGVQTTKRRRQPKRHFTCVYNNK